MKIAIFDTHRYDRASFERANAAGEHELVFFEPRLNQSTAPLALGFEVVCPFVNCRLDIATFAQLSAGGTRLVALRAAGFNGIDLAAARRHGVTVVRVPAYSPHAVAEHVFALLLTLVRKTHRAYNRVRESDFSLDGLVGFDLHGKTFGVVGVGKIGRVVANIAAGFGCKVLLHDPQVDAAFAERCGGQFTSVDELFAQADLISLHLPLTPSNRHMINAASLTRCKPGAILINTSRGGLIDTTALIEALKSGHLGGVALDVYELEEGVFFEDLSDTGIADDQLARLITFPNVLISSHQGFLTREALSNISDTTLANVSAFAAGEALPNQIGV